MSTGTRTPPLPRRHKNDPCCPPPHAPSLTLERTAALADPTRLRLLDLIAQQEDPLCVCEITPQFAQLQPTISHHLRALREAGLIETDRRGIWAYYGSTDMGRRTLQTIQALP
ncbi:MAG TPA: metalloregulator ArsR/SmtB family transcription factor [Chloroflexota bacterium]|nr:metalloregulator ArsR/SmtB family transcription factor [Chloroflexota bacterium]